VVGLAACRTGARSNTADWSSEHSVAALLKSNVPTGAVISLRGYCLPRGGELPLGPTPVSRSDWQLADVESDSVAIFVSGSPPPECGYLGTARNLVTISATIARDSIPGILGRPARRRTYLVTP